MLQREVVRATTERNEKRLEKLLHGGILHILRGQVQLKLYVSLAAYCFFIALCMGIWCIVRLVKTRNFQWSVPELIDPLRATSVSVTTINRKKADPTWKDVERYLLLISQFRQRCELKHIHRLRVVFRAVSSQNLNIPVRVFQRSEPII